MAFSTIIANSNAVLQDRNFDAGGDTLRSAFAIINANFAEAANVASPTLTGTPLAPTAAEGTDSTQIATTAFVPVKVASVSLTNAQVLALRTTPITIIPAPAAGYMIKVLNGVMAFDYTAAYTETSDDLQLKYVDGSGSVASASVDSTGFLTATADTMIEILPSVALAKAKTAVDAAAVVLHNTGDGELGGGNAANVVRLKVYYQIVPLGW